MCYSDGDGWNLDVLFYAFVVRDVCNTNDEAVVVCTNFLFRFFIGNIIAEESLKTFYFLLTNNLAFFRKGFSSSSVLSFLCYLINGIECIVPY